MAFAEEVFQVLHSIVPTHDAYRGQMHTSFVKPIHHLKSVIYNLSNKPPLSSCNPHASI